VTARARKSSVLLATLLPLVFIVSNPGAAVSQPVPGSQPPDARTESPALPPMAPPGLSPGPPAPNPVSPVVPLPGVLEERQPVPPPPTIPAGPATREIPVSLRGTSVGPFELKPSVVFAEEFTDNFERRRDGTSNLRSSVAPGATLLIRRGVLDGSVGYQPSATHDTVTDDFGLFHSLAATVRWLPTPRLTFTVTDTFTLSDNPEDASRLSLRRDRETFTSNVLGLQADYVLGTVGTRGYYRLSTFTEGAQSDTVTHAVGTSATATFYETNTATLGYEYTTSSTSDATDIDGHQVTVSVARQLTALASLGATGSYLVRTATGPGARDYDAWSAALFTGYGIPGRWTLNGSLGVSRLSGATEGDEFTVTSNTTFTYVFARAVAKVGFERGFAETFRENQNFGVVDTQGVTASLEYPFGPGILARLAAEYRENDLTGLNVGTTAGSQRREDTWSVSLDVTIRLLEWLDLMLAYSHREFETPTPDAFTENRVRVSLGARF
jgi:hypothetical protein